MPKKKTAKKTAKRIAKTEEPKAVFARLVVFGKLFTADGETVSEAIANLKPGTVNGKIILAVTKDGQTRERILAPMVARRLFNTAGISREVALKNVSMIF